MYLKFCVLVTIQSLDWYKFKIIYTTSVLLGEYLWH